MIHIDSSNSIILDGIDTGLKLSQQRKGTVVYTPERPSMGQIPRFVKKELGRNANGVMAFCEEVVYVPDFGEKYKEHPMPFARYSAAHDTPHKPGEEYAPAVCAGRKQLEADLRALLAQLAKNK